MYLRRPFPSEFQRAPRCSGCLGKVRASQLSSRCFRNKGQGLSACVCVMRTYGVDVRAEHHYENDPERKAHFPDANSAAIRSESVKRTPEQIGPEARGDCKKRHKATVDRAERTQSEVPRKEIGSDPGFGADAETKDRDSRKRHSSAGRVIQHQQPE